MPSTSLIGRGRSGLVALCSAVLLAAATYAAADTIVLPPGTVVPVRLDTNLNSSTAATGDRFTADVRYGRDAAGLPEGTRVEGVVRDAEPAGDGQPGTLDLDFRRIIFPDGTTQAVDASLVSLDSKHVRTTSSGRLVAIGSGSNDRMKFVGLGAGAGLLVGALTHGNTLLDTLLGAGAGYLFGQYGNTGSRRVGDVNLTAGTEFGMRLDRQLAFDSDLVRGQYAQGNGYDDRYYSDTGTYRRAHRTYTMAPIGMLVNDQSVVFGAVRPFVRNGVVYVPLETVASAAGFDYTYDADEHMVRAMDGDLRLGIDSRVAVLDGVRHRMPGPAMMRDGVLYVPMEFIPLVTGGTIRYDRPARTIVLTMPGY